MIKTTTHCPTCGAECKVEGHTTQYYRPVSSGELKRIEELEAENESLRAQCGLRQIQGYHEGTERAAEIAYQAWLDDEPPDDAIRAKLDKP